MIEANFILPGQDKKYRLEYPYIGELDDYVVLFTSKNCGVSLKHGLYRTTWREDEFVPYIGDVLIRNER